MTPRLLAGVAGAGAVRRPRRGVALQGTVKVRFVGRREALGHAVGQNGPDGPRCRNWFPTGGLLAPIPGRRSPGAKRSKTAAAGSGPWLCLVSCLSRSPGVLPPRGAFAVFSVFSIYL